MPSFHYNPTLAPNINCQIVATLVEEKDTIQTLMQYGCAISKGNPFEGQYSNAFDAFIYYASLCESAYNRDPYCGRSGMELACQ